MSIVFLDTEFNGHGGDLLSIGMVSSDGDEFYQVVRLPGDTLIHPWVKENVFPKLLAPSQKRDIVRANAFAWLNDQEAPLIIADWPADFIHLLDLMYKEHDPSQAFAIELRMELIDTPVFEESWHALRHNALSDAWTLRDWYMKSFEPTPPRKRPLLDHVLQGKLK